MKQVNEFDIDANEIKSFDIKEYILKVISNWKLFLMTLVLGLSLASFVNRFKQKVYSLNSSITVKEEQNPLFTSTTNIAFNWGGPSDKVETIITILKSRSHNEKVVSKLKYYINYLQEGRFRMVDVYGKVPFEFALDSVSSQLLNTPIKLEFLENDEVTVSVKYDEDTYSVINYFSNTIDTYVTDDNSFSKKYNVNDIVETPFSKFKIQQKSISSNLAGKTYFILFKSFNGTVRSYQGIKAKTLTKGTSIIELELIGTNKYKIEDYINTTVEVLDSAQSGQKIQYAKKTKEYIDGVFEFAANNLKVIEKELGDYKQKNKVYNLSIEGEALMGGISELDTQQERTKNRLEYYNNLEGYLNANKEIESDILAPVNVNIEDANISKNIVELVELSKQKKNLEGTVTSNYPGLKKINDNIEITRNIVLENLSNLKNETQASLKNIKRRIGTYNSRLRSLPKKEQGLIKFERNYNLTAANYEYLKQKQYEAGTAIAANVSDIKILDKAKDVGQGPISPKPLFNYLVAAMLSLGLPLLFIIVKEALSNKIMTVEDIEKNYKIPVLGVIGRANIDSYLAVFEKPKSTLAESFRAIRSNIQFLFKKGGRSKTIVVTSSVSGEGKTLCSVNMASVFAMSEKKVILLGMDFRKPKLHEDINATNEVGLVNYLIDQIELEEAIQPTQVPNLDVITAGPVPPNPSELLLSDQTGKLMEYLKENYDYILIDTPPVGLVADAIELFKYADAVIYVIRQNYTQRGMPKMIDDKYKNGEVKNISYVLNDFTIKDSYGYGNGYGYGYGYGGGYGYGKYGNGYHESEKKTSWIRNLFGKK